MPTPTGCANAFARAIHPAQATPGVACTGIKADVGAVWTFVHADELSFKKALLPAEQDRPDVGRKRTCWKAHQGTIGVARLVSMAPPTRLGPCGQLLQASAPFGYLRTMTFIAALRHDRISAPWCLMVPSMVSSSLYVEKVLAPIPAPGEIVVLHDLGSPFRPRWRQFLRPGPSGHLTLGQGSEDDDTIGKADDDRGRSIGHGGAAAASAGTVARASPRAR